MACKFQPEYGLCGPPPRRSLISQPAESAAESCGSQSVAPGRSGNPRRLRALIAARTARARLAVGLRAMKCAVISRAGQMRDLFTSTLARCLALFLRCNDLLKRPENCQAVKHLVDLTEQDTAEYIPAAPTLPLS